MNTSDFTISRPSHPAYANEHIHTLTDALRALGCTVFKSRFDADAGEVFVHGWLPEMNPKDTRS